MPRTSNSAATYASPTEKAILSPAARIARSSATSSPHTSASSSSSSRASPEATEAALWFRAAAEQGEPEACYSLGVVYEYGMIGSGGSGGGGGCGDDGGPALSSFVGQHDVNEEQRQQEQQQQQQQQLEGWYGEDQRGRALLWYHRAAVLGFHPAHAALRALQQEEEEEHAREEKDVEEEVKGDEENPEEK